MRDELQAQILANSLVAALPPETLYYGTDPDGMRDALMGGLAPCTRLFEDITRLRDDGATVVFTVFAQAAYADGQSFWRSQDGAWMTDAVETDYLYLPPVRGEE